MATIKVKFRQSSIADCAGTLYYQIIHERKVRQIISGHKLLASEWDAKRSTVTVAKDSERQEIIAVIRENVQHDVGRLLRIIRRLESCGLPYTVDDVVERYHRFSADYSLFGYMEGIIAKLQSVGRIRTSQTYKSTLSSFRKFNDGKDIMLDCITTDTMETYEAWLRNRGVTSNTVSFYLRILRAVYNRAVENEIVEDRRPFRHVYTGIDKTIKRALPLKIIKKIKTLDLSTTPTLDFARDMFMMSFYFRGMSFIDMAFLRKTDLKNGYVIYRRRKTGQQLIIRWTREMQSIVDKYPANKNRYLLPIICDENVNERNVYCNRSCSINRSLKRIAEKIGLTVPLTLYVARHSWASAAKSKGIPLSVISEGMGHDSEKTTRIYLASLDISVVDRANALILSSLK